MFLSSAQLKKKMWSKLQRPVKYALNNIAPSQFAVLIFFGIEITGKLVN